MLELYCKPFPCCFWAMTAVRLCLLLRRRHPSLLHDPGMISAVIVHTFKEACALGAGAGVPTTPVEAQYSVTWPVACALVDGGCGPEHSESAALNSTQIRTVFQQISMREKPEHSRGFPERLLADVEIQLKNGTTVQATTADLMCEVESSASERRKPYNRTSDAEVLGEMDANDMILKYQQFAHYGFGATRAEQVERLVMQLGVQECDVSTPRLLNDLLVLPLNSELKSSI